MRRAWSFYGVIMLFYVGLVLPASIGAFALGELGAALFLVLGISAPLVALCALADLLTPPAPLLQPADHLDAEL